MKMNSQFRLSSLLILVFCMLFSTTFAFGQSELATLFGLVTDQQASVVAGVDVVVTNVATNVTARSLTNSAGFYSFPSLKPGGYTVSYTKEGFKRVDVAHLILNVQDSISRNIQLEVGSVATPITVSAEASRVNVTDAAVSTVVDRQFVENMPLNGRSLQALIQLTPGVAMANEPFGSPGQFSVNGQRPEGNYYTVDGTSANVDATSSFGDLGAGALPALSATGGTNNLVSIDAMQEFKIQTSTYAPEFGRTPGAQISIVTRSGTNEFHGTAFEYLRNDVLDAADWFADYNGLPKGKERQNDFGGVFGGPILKNRLFFFFSYEGQRLRQPQTATALVPSTALRTEAPASMQPILNAFPKPNRNDGSVTGIFAGSYSDSSTLDATSIRADYALTDKISVFGRFNHAPSLLVARHPVLSQLSGWNADLDTVTTGATITLKPNLLDEFRFNYSHARGGNSNYLDTFGGAVIPPDSYYRQLYPQYQTGDGIDAYFNLPGGSFSWYIGPYLNTQQQINVVDTVASTLGSHSIKAGFDYRRLKSVFNYPPYYQEPIFNAVSDVLSGAPSSTYVSADDTYLLRPLVQNLSLYAQDTWKVTPNLTLTYGVRWEYNPPPSETSGRGFYTVTNLNDPPNVALAPKRTRLWNATHANFAPRLGVAYTARRTPGSELVIRGGGGIFYDLGNNNGVRSATGFPYVRAKYAVSKSYPLSTADATPEPFSLDPPYSDIYAYSSNLKLPRTYQWNLSLQQSLGPNQSVSATYLGSAGRDLLRYEFLNSLAGLNPDFSGIYVTTNSSYSNYDALQLQYQRRLSHGLQVLASYTWSHSLDNLSGTGRSINTPSSIIYNLNRDYASSDFDVKHSFSTAITYNIPSPRKFRLARAVAGNWSLDSLFRGNSAPPIYLVTGLNPFGFEFGDTSFARPDVVPGQPLYLYGSGYPGGKRINPAAFQDPTSPTAQGTLGRNALRGFGAWEEDLTIRREFPIHEQVKLQFRAEFFNIFNHPNFAAPGAGNNAGVTNVIGDPLFGQSTQTLAQGSYGSGFYQRLNPLYQMGGPRSIELALKLTF